MKAILLCAAAAVAYSQTYSASPALDALVEQAVHDGLIPGAVLIVGQDGRILHRKAYGERALIPAREAMTVDTIFDVASLTKVIATTPSLMKLFEQGKLRIADPVTAYLPEFQGGKSDITIRDLMTHFSGLRPDLRSGAALDRLRDRHPSRADRSAGRAAGRCVSSIATSISFCWARSCTG